MTRDFIAFCLTFAPDSPPWEGTAGAFPRPPRYPGWETNHPAAFYLDGWFYTQEGVGTAHWPGLATYRPATAVLAVGTNGWIDPAIVRAEPDQAVFTGVMGTLIHAELLGHALCQMIGRTSPTLGRHTRFFTTHEGAMAFASEQLMGIAMGSPVTHATLSGVRISAAATSPIRLISEGVEPTAVSLPASLTTMVATSAAMVARVERPSLGITLRETAFTRVWQAYMPGAVIPYDRRGRRRRFQAAYRDLAPYIAKWERLRDLGPQDLSKRFDRNPRLSERL